MNMSIPVQWIDPNEAAREEELARAANLLRGFTGTLLGQTHQERLSIAEAANVAENIGRFER